MCKVRVRDGANSIYLDPAELFRDPAAKRTLQKARRLAVALDLSGSSAPPSSASAVVPGEGLPPDNKK